MTHDSAFRHPPNRATASGPTPIRASDSSIERPLPHNLEAEKAILGAILLDNHALNVAGEKLHPQDFFLAQNRLIFKRMMNLAAKPAPIDTVTLMEILAQHDELEAAGGAAYLSQLADGLPRATSVEHYAGIVKEKSTLRSLAFSADAIKEQALAAGDDADVILDRAESTIVQLRESSGNKSLVVVSVDELVRREIKPREMLLDPIIPSQGLVMLYSFRGEGKSYLAMAAAAAVAAGGRFLRWMAPRARRVLYVDGELPAITMQERFHMILSGMDDRPAPGALQIITPDFQELGIPDLATPEGQQRLEPYTKGMDLVVLDNLSALCRAGDENESEGWLPIQDFLLRLRRKELSVLIVHHAGKNKTQRGTSKKEDLLDVVITLKRPSDYCDVEGLRSEIHFEKKRGMVGEAAKPFEVKLQSGLDGRAVWTWRELDDVVSERAALLFGEGMSVRDVAEELGISKSRAGRLRRKI